MAKKGKSAPTETTAKAKNDAWTGMLAIALLALIAGNVLLFLDYSQYHPSNPPPKVQKVLPTGDTPPAGEPAPKTTE